MRKGKGLELLCITVVFIIAFLAGYLSGVCGYLSKTITISTEINPVQLASLLTTLFGITFISFLLDRHKDVSKFHRELLIKKIDDLTEALNSTLPESSNGWYELSDIVKNLKTVSIDANRINKILLKINDSEPLFYQNFIKEFRKLRNLLTYIPPRRVGGVLSSLIVLRGGKLMYDKKRIAEIETSIDRLETTILDLQVNSIHI